MTFRYLIGYLSAGGASGSVELTLTHPIRDMNDINQIQQNLVRQFGLTSPLVMGFSRFEEN